MGPRRRRPPAVRAAPAGSRRRGAEAELARDGAHRRDDVADVVVELEAEQLGPRGDLLAVHARREGGLLELLLDRLRLERLDPVGAHEAAGVHEAGELVAGEEGALERRVAGQLEVLRMGEDGLDDLLRPALLAQDGRAVLRVLVERGVHLVVEVVEERDGAPELLVLTLPARVEAQARLHGEGVAEEGLALRVPREGFPRALAGDLHWAE